MKPAPAAGGAAGIPSARSWGLAPALLICLAAPAFFVVRIAWVGWVLIAAGMAVAWLVEHRRGGVGDGLGVAAPFESAGPGRTPRAPSLVRDLSLIALGLLIVSAIDLQARLDNVSMVRFGVVLGAAVAVPYLVSRFLFRDGATSFPWRGGGRWGRFHWTWLVAVLVLGWLILPFYFITSGVYQNWPVVDSPELIARLFVGVGAVGIWDELFFICTVFVLLRRHMPTLAANLLQAVVFVSFLWELGYREWGPLLTIPFALLQGWIFLRMHSLAYVVTVHLLFDAVVFAVLVHAHNPGLLPFFLV